MHISRRGLELLKQHEGLRLKAYPDPASGGDPWTIGYGHTHGVKQGDEITAEQAEDFLLEDLGWVEDCLARVVRVPLAQAQFDALASLIFNIGAPGFERSTLLRKLNAGDYAGAAEEFGRWNMAAGAVNAGLTRRRGDERALFLSGEAPGAQTGYVPPKAHPWPFPRAGDVDPTANIPIEPDEAPAPTAGSIPAGEADPVESNMPLPAILGALLPSLIEAVPRLGKLFGDGSAVRERNVKAAELAMQIAQQAVGAVNAQETVEKVKTIPAAAAAATKAIEARWLELDEAGGGGIEGARKADAAYAAGPWHAFMHSPSFWVALLLLPLVYMIVGNVVGLIGKPLSDEVRSAISNGVVGIILGGLIGYYYGQTTSRNRSQAT